MKFAFHFDLIHVDSPKKLNGLKFDENFSPLDETAALTAGVCCETR